MNWGCWTVLAIVALFYLAIEFAPSNIKLAGEYCSEKTTVKYPPFAGGGEGWLYTCVQLNEDSTCTVMLMQSGYGNSKSWDGKWSQISKNSCKIYGVSTESHDYNGAYQLDGDELKGKEPIYGVYKRDYTPRTW